MRLVKAVTVMYLNKWKRISVVLLVVWIVVTYLVISPLRCSQDTSDEETDYEDRLREVTSQLESLRRQHTDLVARIKRSGVTGLESVIPDSGPSEGYENIRHRVYSNTKELWNFIQYELSKRAKMKSVLDQIQDRKRSLLADQQMLATVDGYAAWRVNEAANVSALVQRRLRRLQNPPDCRAARKLTCNLNKGCGFGCQLHHIVYCLIVAYATERTLILNSLGWRYNPKGWENVFQPLSETCTSTYNEKASPWSPSSEGKVVSLRFIDTLPQKPQSVPLAIPKDLARRIVRFNGDPASWWIGQILKYILKPQASVQKDIDEIIDKMNYKSPIVGVHIRRTDKVGTEAAFHHLHEYMSHVVEYYDTRQLIHGKTRRRVYLASDDDSVLEKARAKYPEYSFIGDPAIAAAAATHRYTPQSLTGLLVDLILLARSDFLVGTFSSQVGRVAYEMMQANRPDASESFASLDDIYYFGGQNAHNRIAIRSHTALADDQIDFEVGDLIGVAGNHWNGFGKGTNTRTNKHGLIPWYKTADHLVLYPFPEYKYVSLYDDTFVMPTVYKMADKVKE